ncbi:MAG: penicillin-binding protein 2 [Alphaproteobacteria bacterium]|nr:penicillin-binding protein 2 [Alphaproteobacteria bacterium]
MRELLTKLRDLVLPAHPDPAQSRRIAEIRLVLCGFIAIAIIGTIGTRIVGLAEANSNLRLAVHGQAAAPMRGRILDRNGRLLAGNLPITVLHANPTEIMNIDAAAARLAPILPHRSIADLRNLLGKKTKYVELDRQLSPKQHAAILQLGIPGVYFAKGMTRIYPRGQTAAHVLGFVDTDHNGIAGIEKALNTELANGQDVTLSLDLGLQTIISHEIQKQIDLFEAIGGAGVILDIHSGEILAAASLPDFNPNQFGRVSDDARFNRATKGLYEMGSTFKVLNTAIALETGAANINQRFEVAKPLRISRFTITDYKPRIRPLNVPEIMVYSSNIGSARIAEAIGAETQRAYMDKLGLLDRLPLQLPETSKPLSPKTWRRTTTATVSYGHGISISMVHLASAIAAAAGTGHWIPPTLIKPKTGEAPMAMRVFSDSTTRAVRSMMRLVVSHVDGSGNFAEAPGYMVGGKTGTAEKIKPGGYNRKANVTTFAAIFPVHDPRYVIITMVDEPKGQKHSYGYATAGWVAAPPIRPIVQQIAPLLGILPVDENSPSIRQKLMLDFKIGNEEATLASY